VAADKKPLIVVKKITVVQAGAHGGSWKVAFADFMTAMMAFFLVMWLIAQSEPTKKNVADYFSTPSIIEYNFSAYGVEITLEKLFLDLMNEPLKVLQDFMQPTDYTPNVMALGSKNLVIAMVSEDVGEYATDVQVNPDEIVFELPEKYLFKAGSDEPTGQFVTVMERVKAVTAGLEDSIVYVDAITYNLNAKVTEGRLDMITKRVQSTLEHDTVDVFGRATVEPGTRDGEGKPMTGLVRFRIKQKELKADGTKSRRFEELFSRTKKADSDVYKSFVQQVTTGRKTKGKAETGADE
jgi:chemotaxis protein MotB